MSPKTPFSTAKRHQTNQHIMRTKVRTTPQGGGGRARPTLKRKTADVVLRSARGRDLLHLALSPSPILIATAGVSPPHPHPLAAEVEVPKKSRLLSQAWQASAKHTQRKSWSRHKSSNDPAGWGGLCLCARGGHMYAYICVRDSASAARCGDRIVSQLSQSHNGAGHAPPPNSPKCLCKARGAKRAAPF